MNKEGTVKRTVAEKCCFGELWKHVEFRMKSEVTKTPVKKM